MVDGAILKRGFREIRPVQLTGWYKVFSYQRRCNRRGNQYGRMHVAIGNTWNDRRIFQKFTNIRRIISTASAEYID